MNYQMKFYKWFTPTKDITDSIKSNHTLYSSIYSSKSNCVKHSSYRTPTTVNAKTSDVQTLLPTVDQPIHRVSIFSWIFSKIKEYICKKQVKVYVNESIETEQEEKNMENDFNHCTKDIWESKESMSKHIVYLSNYYKENKDLYKITNQIRNCISLSSEDVDNIMHFKKNEILTIILLQNYCLEHHREHIELLSK
jgi:hypothetical protein